MYPHVRQFETRRRDVEREFESTRAADRIARPRVGPPRHKLALLTWVGAYPLITLILVVLGPMMATWPLALRTLVLSVTMVVALTGFIMPRLMRLFGPWLLRDTSHLTGGRR
jgi:antibiotic biosynthesis monooxygenase (ABM) superfamily enzyme